MRAAYHQHHKPRSCSARPLLEVNEHATREGITAVLRSMLGTTKGPSRQGERKILLGHSSAESQPVVARVNAAATEDLERWAVQILQASSLDDVFR